MMRILAFSLLLAFSQNGFSNNIKFIQNDVRKGVTKAIIEDKVCVVEFYADWCLPCQIMEQSTWVNEDVVRFFEENCTLVKVDIDSDEGAEYTQRYNIKRIPVILILDQDANEVSRLENSVSSSKLLEFVAPHVPARESAISEPAYAQRPVEAQPERILPIPAAPVSYGKPQEKPLSIVMAEKIAAQPNTNGDKARIINPAGAPAKPRTEVVTDTRQTGILREAKVVIEKKTSKKVPVKQPVKSNASPGKAKVIKGAERTTPKSATFTVKSIRKELHNGNFTVQIGAFGQMENAENARTQYARQFNKPAAILEPDHNLETKLYRVYIGGFTTRKEADKFKAVLLKNGIDAIVKQV